MLFIVSRAPPRLNLSPDRDIGLNLKSEVEGDFIEFH